MCDSKDPYEQESGFHGSCQPRFFFVAIAHVDSCFIKVAQRNGKKHRSNVRLRKLQGGDVKGTFLAYAGLKRMSMEDPNV